MGRGQTDLEALLSPARSHTSAGVDQRHRFEEAARAIQSDGPQALIEWLRSEQPALRVSLEDPQRQTSTRVALAGLAQEAFRAHHPDESEELPPLRSSQLAEVVSAVEIDRVTPSELALAMITSEALGSIPDTTSSAFREACDELIPALTYDRAGEGDLALRLWARKLAEFDSTVWDEFLWGVREMSENREDRAAWQPNNRRAAHTREMLARLGIELNANDLDRSFYTQLGNSLTDQDLAGSEDLRERCEEAWAAATGRAVSRHQNFPERIARAAALAPPRRDNRPGAARKLAVACELFRPGVSVEQRISEAARDLDCQPVVKMGR